MDESAIKGLKSLELNDSDAAVQKPSCIWNIPVREISVEGYDPCSLQKYALKLTLRRHFASCGRVLSVSVFKSVAFMRIEGEDAKDKALELSGTDVGGWTAIVKAAPWQSDPFVRSSAKIKDERVLVSGYDTCLPEIDIQIALCKHFSSYGEVTQVMVLPSLAILTIQGEECEEKALKLSGRDLGGMNLVVERFERRPENVKRKWVSYRPTGYTPPSLSLELAKKKKKEKEMEMEKEMEKEMEMEMEMEKMKKKMEKMKKSLS